MRLASLVFTLSLAALAAAQPVLQYDSATGDVSFSSSRPVTTLDLFSATNVFTGSRSAGMDSDFDVFMPDHVFRLDPTGFQQFDFGQAVAPNLSAETFLDGLCINGSHLGGGRIAATQFRMGEETWPLDYCFAESEPITVYYDPLSGEVTLDVIPGLALREIQLVSQSHALNNQNAQSADGPFDIAAANRLVIRSDTGFGDLQFGAVLDANLDPLDVVQDLCFTGFLADGTSLNPAAYNGNASIPLRQCTSTERTAMTNPAFDSEPTGQVDLHYSSATGELHLNVASNQTLATLELVSSRAIFSGDANSFLMLDGQQTLSIQQPALDNRPQTLAPYHDISLGTVADLGLSDTLVANDLCVSGRFSDGSPLETVHLNGDVSLSVCTTASPALPLPFVSLNYDSASGQLSLDVANAVQLKAFRLESAAGVFATDTLPDALSGERDQLTANVLENIDVQFGDLDFLTVLPAGMSDADVLADLCAGAGEAGHPTGTFNVFLNGDFAQPMTACAIVPEPDVAFAMALVGVVVLLAARRATRTF